MKTRIISFMLLWFTFQAIGQEFSIPEQQKHQLGQTTVQFITTCKQPAAGVVFVHVHENETTAFESTQKLLEKYQWGCLVTLKSQGQRNITFNWQNKSYSFDPNRIYTPKGRIATLAKSQPFNKEVDKMVNAMADSFLNHFIKWQRLVIAVHNNTDGGGLTIHSFKKGGVFAADAKKVFINPAHDEDDFFYTTDHRIFNFLKKKGFNVLLQHNEKVADDGSLSVYAAQKQIPYLNIETQAGEEARQLVMLEAAWEMMNLLFLSAELPTQAK